MKNHILKKIFITTLVTLATTAITSMAFAADKEDNRGSDKVDLKKLEDKYWAAKDEDYGVIQNRTFAKAKKPYLSLVTGTLINDPFVKATAFGAMLGYYFTEDFGLEISHITYSSTKSDSVDKFISVAASTSPNYNLVKSNTSLVFAYTPLYAKLAFMNMSIMYFDMGITLGAGVTNYEQAMFDNGNANSSSFIKKTAPHIEFGVMQQLFITKAVAIRADFKNTFYQSLLVPYQTNFNTPYTEEKKSTNDTTLSIGLTYFQDL